VTRPEKSKRAPAKLDGSPGWVVIQLNARGEIEDLDILRAWFARKLKGAELYIPATISQNGENQVIHWLVKGYVFARRTAPDHLYLALKESRYVDFVLTSTQRVEGYSRLSLACISDREVDQMRKQASIESEQGISVDDEVQVTSGPYRGINGKVITEIPELDSVQVFIKLRSKQDIVTLPRSFLKFVSRDGDGESPVFSPFATKILRIREWLDRAGPILSWRPVQPMDLLASRDRLRQIETWLSAQTSYTKFLRAVSPYGISALEPSALDLRERAARTKRLVAWCGRGSTLFLCARADARFETLSTDAIDAGRERVAFMDDALRRVAEITSAVRRIERTLTTTPETMENVLFDGMNLAMRVHHAFGATGGKFQDAEGRPTETIYGFLKNLSAFRKRFPSAVFYVAWEGSSARRRAFCPEYKANRPTTTVAEGSFDQIACLRQILPLLGVEQVWHPEEEADDALATLVRGALRGKRNVLVSTDHDFLQLVTLTDVVLVPKVASRPEVIYDADKVVESYGVSASLMPELRAFLGDTSDNLKGVPRVPTKVLTSLLQAHGSVDGIYASGLAGLTANQYTKLREAEATVRRNVSLMALRTDLALSSEPAAPDEEKARAKLEALSIRPDTILGPFFRSTNVRGFFKTSS
jgi:5'-3' exonuclease/transcription antitermination factor NusG